MGHDKLEIGQLVWTKAYGMGIVYSHHYLSDKFDVLFSFCQKCYDENGDEWMVNPDANTYEETLKALGYSEISSVTRFAPAGRLSRGEMVYSPIHGLGIVTEIIYDESRPNGSVHVHFPLDDATLAVGWNGQRNPKNPDFIHDVYSMLNSRDFIHSDESIKQAKIAKELAELEEQRDRILERIDTLKGKRHV